MILISGTILPSIASNLCFFAHNAGVGKPGFFDAEMRKATTSTLAIHKERCERLGLSITTRRLQELIEDIEAHNSGVGPTAAMIEDAAAIDKLFREELESVWFLYLEKDKSALFRARQPFGPEVEKSFRTTEFDLLEAKKCLALSRATACVFHLMRALEIVVKLVAVEVGVQCDLMHLDSQGTILDQIESKIREMDKNVKRELKTKEWVERKEFYSRIASRLALAKNAWRDNVAHARSKYTEEEADGIYRVVGDIMKEAAKSLAEPPDAAAT